MAWYKTGEEAMQEIQKKEVERTKKREGRRFWLKAGEEADILFLMTKCSFVMYTRSN